ncbi:hypothetical protein B7463_g3042, partial [Scytalidium lignicola]
MFSSQTPESLHHDFGAIIQDSHSVRIRGFYHISSALALNGSRIIHVSIQDVSLHQGDLEKFCNGLGNEVETVLLQKIQLLNGTWAGTLEILRGKVLFRGCSGRQRPVTFSMLTGGGFGRGNAWGGSGRPWIFVLAEEYVLKAEAKENPLRMNE